jgi:hypothetical protein
MGRDVYTIDEYCQAEGISRSTFYVEQQRGHGVEFFRRGAKVFITEAARLRHRKELERRTRAQRATPVGAAKPELATA